MPTVLVRLNLQNFDTRQFLDSVWQNQPAYFPKAAQALTCPVGPEDIAGMATLSGADLGWPDEQELVSRLVEVNQSAKRYNLRFGPFSDQEFRELPEAGWTVLVQTADRVDPELARYWCLFDFLPNFAKDDIMVSYAAAQGSVGPHMDRYDVFLIGGMGERTWHVEAEPRTEEPVVDGPLQILDDFDPSLQFTLQEGDVLYIPARFAHYGIADDESITISAGFRTPNQLEITSAYAAYWAAGQDDDIHLPVYADASPVRLTDEELESVYWLAGLPPADSSGLRRHLSLFLNSFRRPPFPLNPLEPDERFTAQDFAVQFGSNLLIRRGEVRFSTLPLVDALYLYASGRELRLPQSWLSFLETMCSSASLEADLYHSANRAQKRFIRALVNEGYLVWVDK